MQRGAVSSASARAAGENAMASPTSEWRLAALLFSAGQSMSDSIGLLGTCVAAETKEAHLMHICLSRVKCCTVRGVAGGFIICVEDGLRIWQGVLGLRRSGVVGAPHALYKGVGLGCSGMMRRFRVVIARCQVIRAE